MKDNGDGDGDDDGGDTRTFTQDESTSREVYVKNLSYDVKPEDVKEFFSEVGEVEDVTLPRFFDSGKPKGFAFVRFANSDAVEKALGMDQRELLERPISVQVNKGRTSAPQARNRERGQGKSFADEPLSEKPDGCKTVFVGNLPWSYTDKQLEKLFAEDGDIVNARVITQRYTQRSRGFGYVEFADTDTADIAVKRNGQVVDERSIRVDFAQVKSVNE